MSSIPDGIDVHVSLNVKKEVASYKRKGQQRSPDFPRPYTTTVNSVQIGNQSGDDAATVTNTLDLKTSVNIPVTKIADGIAANTFTFGLKDVTANIDSLVDQAGNKITLKNSVNLAEQALTASDRDSHHRGSRLYLRGSFRNRRQDLQIQLCTHNCRRNPLVRHCRAARRNGGRRVRHHGLSCEDHHDAV